MPARRAVDPQSATPVYVQVADIVRLRIESGELQPDRPVPSESQLQQEPGIARGTARKAIMLLREQGLVERSGDAARTSTRQGDPGSGIRRPPTTAADCTV